MLNNEYFNDLNRYVDDLSGLASTLYSDKVNVNLITEDLVSTHVTAQDLNKIKESLSTLIDNVNDINSHLINADFSTSTDLDLGAGNTINNSLNLYLANDYIKKNQLVIDNHTVNDSVLNLDDIYLRGKNIFVDGYKISTTSPYNLVSFSQLNLTINGLSSDFMSYFESLRNSLTSDLENLTKKFPSAVTVNAFPVWEDGGQWVGQHILSTDANRRIDITVPLQELNTGIHTFVDSVYHSLYNSAYNWYETNSGRIDDNYYFFKTVETNEYSQGIRLIGSGYKFFNKNDIYDPSFREYKYFRVYSANTGTTVPDITIFFAPYHVSMNVGYDFPVKGTVNSKVDHGITIDNTTPATDKQFNEYILRTRLWDYMKHSQGPTNEVIKYQERDGLIYQGFQRGWMECGGQQRVYAEVRDGYVYLKPSAILFPIPFDTGQGLDIQVTVKRDCVQPLTAIIPVCVVDEDTYYFTIAGGGQGLANGTSGFMYVKWNAKGIYLVNNLIQYYYLQQGYDKIHNLYWLNECTVNPRINIRTSNNPLKNYLSSEELFRDVTQDQLVSLLVDDFKWGVSASFNGLYAYTQWFYAYVDLDTGEYTPNHAHALYCDWTQATGPAGADPNDPFTWGYALGGHYINRPNGLPFDEEHPQCPDYRLSCIDWANNGWLSSFQICRIDPNNLIWEQDDNLDLQPIYSINTNTEDAKPGVSAAITNKWTGEAGQALSLQYRKGTGKYHFLLGTTEANCVEYQIDTLWHYYPSAFPVSADSTGAYSLRTDLNAIKVGLNEDLGIVSGTNGSTPFSSVYWKSTSDYYYNTDYYIDGEVNTIISNYYSNWMMNNYGNRSLISLTFLKKEGIVTVDLAGLYSKWRRVDYNTSTGEFEIRYNNGSRMRILIPDEATTTTFGAAITKYPFIIKSMKCFTLKDKLNIMSSTLPLLDITFDNNGNITNIAASSYIANLGLYAACGALRGTAAYNSIKTYLNEVLLASNAWDKSKIRLYATTYSTNDITAYIEPNTKASINAGELWEYMKPGENYATRNAWQAEEYWKRNNYPSAITVDDDRLRLRSTKLSSVNGPSSWMKYKKINGVNTIVFDDKDH